MELASKPNNYNIRKKPKTLTLCENNFISNKKINKKEYSTENLNKNRKLKYNSSLTTFNNRNILNNKNKTKKKLTTTLSSSQLRDIKSDIYSTYNRNNQFKIFKDYKNTSKDNKDVNININYENKYEIYNKDDLAYRIYHDYQKINFNNENLNFLERMELYGIKRNIKDAKVKEYINLKSPKFSENRRKKIFDNLINDCEFRKKKKASLENIINQNFIQNNKKVSKKRMNEIVNRLYRTKRYRKKQLNENKENENNIEIKEVDNRENINNINNNELSNKNIKIINKSNSHKNMDKIYKLNKRLYYKEKWKKDIPYKLFLQKVNELLGINNKKIINNIIEIQNFSNRNNNNNNNINNDFLNFSQLVNLRQIKKKNNQLNNRNYSNNNIYTTKYNFKEDNSLVNSYKEDNKKNEENSEKDIRLPSNNINETKNNNDNNDNNDKKQNNNLICSQNQNNIDNLKIAIIIDNFFSNK